uniref:glutathione S-transferase L3-like n=1 Tax=Erigeron canadensis TaxID=72917 RepID=UPI001CB8F2A1|nr:glutathione S-transferase L3-like [Erigeron canadensis]
MAAVLNLNSISRCHYHLDFQSPPVRNVASAPIIILPYHNKISISRTPLLKFHHQKLHNKLFVQATTTMSTGVQEDLPPALDSTSEPPSVFDGTTRLYISYTCPYAQRVWITRNCKGLQEKIKLVPIDLKNRPEWYKEKVYPPNKVPALEHNNEVKGESLDLIKFIDTNFEGPSLYPEDIVKKEFGEELLSYTNTFYKSATTSFKGDGVDDAAAAFDQIEESLSKFDDGPFFLGQFSLVDIAYAPFVERFHPYLLNVKTYDIRVGRPKLAAWIEEMNKNEGFNQTRRDPEELVQSYKKRFLPQQ